MQVILETDEDMRTRMSHVVSQIREEASRKSRRGRRC